MAIHTDVVDRALLDSTPCRPAPTPARSALHSRPGFSGPSTPPGGFDWNCTKSTSLSDATSHHDTHTKRNNTAAPAASPSGPVPRRPAPTPARPALHSRPGSSVPSAPPSGVLTAPSISHRRHTPVKLISRSYVARPLTRRNRRQSSALGSVPWPRHEPDGAGVNRQRWRVAHDANRPSSIVTTRSATCRYRSSWLTTTSVLPRAFSDGSSSS